MTWSLVVDALLLLALIGAGWYGWASGFLRTAAGLVGLIVGGVAAFLLMPWAAALVPDPGWRIAATLGVATLAIAIGATLGAWVGRMLRRGARAVRLGTLDRLLGAAAAVVVGALVILLVGTGIAAMGVPALSPALARSRVVDAIRSITPTPAQSFLAEVRSAAVGGALPWIVEVMDGPTTPPSAPTGGVDDPEVIAASGSVVRITGAAVACGRISAGSGVVVAPDRVLTNAHVVAGVDEPMVESPDGIVADGTVVAYSADEDLALIAVDLDAAPIALAEQPGPGSDVVFAGYPFGGPFEVRPARVEATGPMTIVVDGRSDTRDVTTLAGEVDPGNSGGPVLTGDGTIGGLVYAKAELVSGVGFAIPVGTLAPYIGSAASLQDAVDSGECSS
ncbi:MarP family serine protease [Agromyces sp. MMS24-JH15]|uniref:MarP family serine protease n=1 Tax=Agromyces sp. MMS24-JH15 TaxID=3243765 RepID=UPI00374A832F